MLRNHFIIAWRNIRRHTSFTLINVAGLSFGVACCLMLALYIQDELSFDRHHKHLENLYRVTTKMEGSDNAMMRTASPPIAHALSAEIPEVEFSARIVTPPGASENLIRYKDQLFYESNGAIADSTLFDVLTFNFTAGTSSKALSDAHSVVVTETLARRLFGNDSALGEVISIQGVGTGDFTVTGVIEDNTKTFLPVNFIISMTSRGGLADYINSDQVSNAWVGQNFVPTFVRLSPDHNVDQVTRKMNQVLQKFGAEELKSRGIKKSIGLEPVKDIYLRSDIGQSPRIISIYIIASIAGFILLIASINFINLSTAQASKRAAEIGIRKVMGAYRSSLIRQVLTEVTLIVLVSVLISILLIIIALPGFNQLTGKEISFDTEKNSFFFVALSILVVITGALAGSYPAFFISSFQPAQVLKGKSSVAMGSGAPRKGLVVLQFTIAIVLVCGMIVVTRQLNYMQETNPGFNSQAKIILPLRTDDARKHYEKLQQQLASMSFVKGTSAANYTPGSFIYSDSRLFLDDKNVEDALNISINSVDYKYVELLDFELIAGRSFTDNRVVESMGKVILNRTAAKAFGLSPEAMVGRRLISQGQKERSESEVIGVIEDFHQVSLREEIRSTLFEVPPSADYYGNIIISLGSTDFQNAVSQIESLWKNLVPGAPFEYSFLNEDIRKQYLSDQRVAKIVSVFTIMALVICCLGLYGLSTFMAEQRVKEIGIRKVLGASISQITGLMSVEFMKLVVIAVAIAVPIAWFFMTRWLRDFAYKIPIDVYIFIYAAACAMIVALITISFKTIRAASADPVKSLKNQ
ncbi:MAG: ABC transporter permease [Chryseolinea sp.]